MSLGLYLIRHFVVNKEVGKIRIQLISKEAKSIQKRFFERNPDKEEEKHISFGMLLFSLARNKNTVLLEKITRNWGFDSEEFYFGNQPEE